jgi:hypothetical protein
MMQEHLVPQYTISALQGHRIDLRKGRLLCIIVQNVLRSADDRANANGSAGRIVS